VSDTLGQFGRFLLTGGLATTLQYLVLGFGTSVLGASAAISSGVGYLAGSVLSYVLSYFFTFRSNRAHLPAAFRFYVMVAVGWCINTLVMALLADAMGWNKWLSQILATAITLAWNFLASRIWVFKAA
jgi:putative flippase GtrA